MEAIIAKTDKIEGLETWLPPRNSTLHLCEQETGPFVTIEDYKKLRDLLQQMLDVAENADETGYVDGVGFVDLDKLNEQVRAVLPPR